MEEISLLVSVMTFISSLSFGNERVPEGAKVFVTVVIFSMQLDDLLFFFAFFCVFGAQHSRGIMDRKGISYAADRGTLHILFAYFCLHLEQL